MAEPDRDLDHLPRFDKPPVAEVAIGIEFLPLPALTVVPLVELRSVWKEAYPNIEEQPAIRRAPSSGFPFPQLGFEVSVGIPPIRIWLLSQDRSELLQIQNDRLILNWRAHFGGTYPHYHQLEPRFLDSWQRFREEIVERSLGELRPITAEVTYINRLVLEQDETLFDALSIFARDAPLRNAEPSVQLSTDLIASDGTPFGQQTISAVRSPDQSEEVQLTLVARVAISHEEDQAIEAALRRAHAVAVTSFADVTTPKMHQRWERTE